MMLAAGARLGHYEILAPIGAGGMGEVYRARYQAGARSSEPAVADGAAAPSSAPVSVANPVFFAGLTPGLAGYISSISTCRRELRRGDLGEPRRERGRFGDDPRFGGLLCAAPPQ
jgi:hypothetical protein